jgi:hypothetical protein
MRRSHRGKHHLTPLRRPPCVLAASFQIACLMQRHLGSGAIPIGYVADCQPHVGRTHTRRHLSRTSATHNVDSCRQSGQISSRFVRKLHTNRPANCAAEQELRFARSWCNGLWASSCDAVAIVEPLAVCLNLETQPRQPGATVPFQERGSRGGSAFPGPRCDVMLWYVAPSSA